MTSLADLPVEILFRMFELSPEIIPILTSAHRDAYDLIYGNKLQGEDFNKYLSLLINNSRKHISTETEEGDIVLNNLKHGVWKKFDITGKEIATISYRLGKFHGEYITDRFELTYNNGILDGPAMYTRDDNYATQYVGRFVKGLPAGEWTAKNSSNPVKYIYHDDNRVTEMSDKWEGEHFYDDLYLTSKYFNYTSPVLRMTDFRRTLGTYEYFSKNFFISISNSSVRLNLDRSIQTIEHSNGKIIISQIPKIGFNLITPYIIFKNGILDSIIYRNTRSRVRIGKGLLFDTHMTLTEQDIPYYDLKEMYDGDFTHLIYYDEDYNTDIIRLTLKYGRFVRCEIPGMFDIEYLDDKFIVKFVYETTLLSTTIIDNNSLNIIADDIQLNFGKRLNIINHKTTRTEGKYKNSKLINLSFDDIVYTYKKNDMIMKQYGNITETYNKEILVTKEISGKKKIFYKDGKISKIISYNDIGEIKSEKEFTYINGKKVKGTYNGIIKLWVYYDDDTLAEYTRKNITENSITNIKYRKDGTMLKISKFKDGKIIRNDKFDEDGNVISPFIKYI